MEITIVIYYFDSNIIGVRTRTAEAAYIAPGLSLGLPGPANIK